MCVFNHYISNFYRTKQDKRYFLADERESKTNVYSDEDLSGIVDVAFKSMDMNDDGVIDFPEYRRSSMN